MKHNALPLFIFTSMVIAWSALTSSAFAEVPDNGSYTPDQALSLSQAAIGRYINDYTLTDSNGEIVKISDFSGRPLVISFVYTSCTNSCLLITQALTNAVSAARKSLGGESFSIVTIGFDSAADDPEQMKSFAAKQGVEQADWKFLSGDLITVSSLADDLGFVFYPTADGFDHLSQVTVIGSDGKVYRQVYGENFEMPLLVEPLKELVFGTTAPFSSLGDLVKKVRLFCTIYDPATEQYRFDYSLFIQLIIGALMVGGMTVFVVREWWRIWNVSRHKKKNSSHHRSSA